MSSRKSIVVWRRALETLQQLGVDRNRDVEQPTEPEFGGSNKIDRHVAVFVDGYNGEKLNEILQIVTGQSQQRGLKPVIITISADLDIIRSFNLPLEIVLDIERQKVDDLPMAIRLDQQLRGIVRLWNPIGVVAFAPSRHEPLVRRLRRFLQEGATN